jgi:hypothetical protein
VGSNNWEVAMTVKWNWSICAVLPFAMIACQSNMKKPTYFTETSVYVDGNGARHVSSKRVTAEEMSAAAQARERASALEKEGIEFAQDIGCNSTSLVLYDHANQTGNHICFSGPATDNLEPYCDEVNFDCVPWDYQAASLRAGSRSGQINTYSTGSCTTATTFVANETKNITCVHNSESAQQN